MADLTDAVVFLTSELRKRDALITSLEQEVLELESKLAFSEAHVRSLQGQLDYALSDGPVARPMGPPLSVPDSVIPPGSVETPGVAGFDLPHPDIIRDSVTGVGHPDLVRGSVSDPSFIPTNSELDCDAPASIQDGDVPF